MPEALKKADAVLQQAVQGITDLINRAALINLDFADVQTVMKDKGIAHIGIGESKGDDKALAAVKMAVESPLLETNITSATDVILNLSGDITLPDVNDAAEYIQQFTGEDINIIVGAMYDEGATDSCTVTVIATGLDEAVNNPPLQTRFGINSAYRQPAVSNTVKNLNVQPTPAPSQPNAEQQTSMQGIQKPVDIRSSVVEKTLKIPDFLQRK